MNFHVALITPSRYDRDGYVQQWKNPTMVTQAQAAVKALLKDCDDRQLLGADVTITSEDHYEIFGPVPVEGIIKRIKEAGNGAVFLTGVLSAFYPRAMDLAQMFRKEGIRVVVGGVHVNGVMALFKDKPYGLQDAIDMGVTLFVGQAEGHMDDLVRDLYSGIHKDVYDYLNDLPDLKSAPMPDYSVEMIKWSSSGMLPIETSRGCPFKCTFCCIPNTQGVKMQMRDPQDIADYVRHYCEKGVNNFFLSDDNIARNKEWAQVFDALAKSKRKHGLKYQMIIEADTVAYKIPGFIEKARAAGVTDVFLGLESIDPDTIKAAGKKHNRAANVRDMFDAWYQAGCVTISGFIVGFPGDDAQKIKRNIDTLVEEYAGEIFTLSVLTPLPGSVDHKRLAEAGTYMDPDLNSYDLGHVVFNHENLPQDDFDRMMPSILRRLYSFKRVWSIMMQGLRNPAGAVTNYSWSLLLMLGYRVEGGGVYEMGLGRYRNRRLRRPSLPIEPAIIFYPKYAWKDARFLILGGATIALLKVMRALAKRKVAREKANSAKPSLQPAE